jgi:hypothetical protein
MAQEPEYAETTIDKLIRILKDWDNPHFFKKWIYGDDSDLLAALDELPCIVISLSGTDVQQGPTGRDELVETVRINLILNRTQYMDTYDENTVGWRKKLELMVQGQNPTGNQYDPTTILGTIRTNFTLNNSITNQIIKVRYGEVPKKDTEERTGEAWITLTITRFVETPNKT